MKKKIRNLTELITQLRSNYFKQYLEILGLPTNNKKNIKCFNPEHADHNPSMRIYEHSAYCFGCYSNFDIFSLATTFEEKPGYGTEFIKDNVFYLADKFGLDHNNIEITEEDVIKSQLYYLTARAAKYILTTNFSDEAIKFLESRKSVQLPENLMLSEYNVGFVDDYAKFIGFVSENNADRMSMIKSANLDNRTIFNPNNIIFVVKDEHNRPVGFAARNIKYISGDKNSQKFVNLASRSEYDIYKKGSRLFGLSNNFTNKKEGTLYIFEGYFDAVVGLQHDIKCAAIGSVAFTREHLSILEYCGIKDVTLCLDGDEVGKEKTFKFIDELLEEPPNLEIRLCFLPENHDPDTYLNEFGAKEFYKLPKLTPFEWRLDSLLHSEDSYSPENICRIMVPYICIYDEHLKRVELSRILSANTGVDGIDIKRQIEEHLNTQEAEIYKEVKDIVQDVTKNVLRHPDQAGMLLSNAQIKIADLQSSDRNESIDVEEYSRFVEAFKREEDEMPEDLLPGYNFGSFKNLQEVFSGNMQGRLIIIPGSPNVGKSSFFANLATGLAINEEEVVPFFHTIDDSRKDIHHRILSILACEYYPKISTPKIQYYKYYSKFEPEIINARNKAYDFYLDLIHQKRLFIKDSAHGITSSYTFNMAKRIEDATGKRVVIFLDNIHNLGDFPHLSGREKWQAVADYVKKSVKKDEFTMFGTVEYKKGSSRAFSTDNVGEVNELIAETIAFEYRADAVMHMYNERHYVPTSPKYHSVEWDPFLKNPIVEAKCTKNKIGSFKGSKFFKFFPETGLYLASSNDEVVDIVKHNNSFSKKEDNHDY